MSEFSELIKNFDKVRDYMRDFFIYGYKTRTDFQYKSLRTYDNEKRRIESWLGDLIKFDTSKKGKQIAISIDSGQLSANPLYKAHKSKSFTDNDICLHFYLLDLLEDASELSVEEITDIICNRYHRIYDPQTVRLKLREYVTSGILSQKKCGKTLRYSLSEHYPESLCSDRNGLSDAITFFSETAPFGVVGSYLLDQLDCVNETFLFKHHFIVHTLEDYILLELLNAMEEKKVVEITHYGKKKSETTLQGVPMKVFVSTQTGRRFVAMYLPQVRRFNSFRLDYIKTAKILHEFEHYDYYKTKFEKNDPLCWGVSFGSAIRSTQCEYLKLILKIDEVKELYILDRLKREGRNGTITKIGDNTYSYYVEVFDTNEMMNWIKTFIGRIISMEGSNQQTIDKFYGDIKRMKELYCREGEHGTFL